jgi:uncharacterized protein YndB with AHSA1/START domain
MKLFSVWNQMDLEPRETGEIMTSSGEKMITVEATINVPVVKVWRCWTEPQHITEWNNASEDWHTPRAKNDLKVGGRFSFYMEAKDGSAGFDFNGVYDQVKPNALIAYTIEGGRKVVINFSEKDGQTNIIETFEAENINPIEMQKNGWQAILNNFKEYVER